METFTTGMPSTPPNWRSPCWESGSGKLRVFLPLFLVVFLSVAVYAGTLTHGLVWDDKGILEYIESITGQGGFPALFTSPFATHLEEGYVSGYYRPVSMWSLWLDSFYVNFFPYQFHLVNILLHGLNTLLVYLLIRLLATPVSAFAGSAIFAVHPVHTESVAFISGRTDLLAALFVLLSVIFWQRVRVGVAARPNLERWVSLGAFVFACLSKEVAYALPGILFLWDLLSPPGTDATGKGWWDRNRFWILGWVAVLALIGATRFSLFGPGMGVVEGNSLAAPAGTASGLQFLPGILLTYARLLIVPWPLRVYYSPNELAVNWITVLASLALALLFAFAAMRGRKKTAIVAAIWLAMFLLPVLMPDQRGGAILAERFLYLPSIGFCLLAGILLDTWPAKRGLFVGGMAVIVALMAFGTTLQNRVWKNEIVLFSEFSRDSPLVPHGYYNLGNALAAQGRDLEAVKEYQRALRIDPNQPKAFQNMGNSFRYLGNKREAIRSYFSALRLVPGFAPSWISLGNVYLEDGEFEKSIEAYRNGLRFHPDDLKMNAGLVLALLRKGDRAGAERHHRFLEGENPELAALIGELLARYAEGENEVVPEPSSE